MLKGKKKATIVVDNATAEGPRFVLTQYLYFIIFKLLKMEELLVCSQAPGDSQRNPAELRHRPVSNALSGTIWDGNEGRTLEDMKNYLHNSNLVFNDKRYEFFVYDLKYKSVFENWYK